MKDFTKYIKTLEKDENFTVESEGRRNTIKVTYKLTGHMYSVHPSDKAIEPLKRWIKNENRTD